MGTYFEYPSKRLYLDWEQTLSRIGEVRSNGELIIFGAGLNSVPLYYRLRDKNISISYFCDNDSAKLGHSFCGKPIISVETMLKGQDRYYVLIGPDYYSEEIQLGLLSKGFPENHIISVRCEVSCKIRIPTETVYGSDMPTIYQFPQKASIAPIAPMVTAHITLYRTSDFYVRRAIESILAQTYANIRLLLIDNGANDDNKQLAAEYAAKDSRVIVMPFEKNIQTSNDKKYVAECNELIKNAITTEFYCGLDSDDYYDIKFIQRTLEAAEKHSADIVAVNSMWYNEATPGQGYRYTNWIDNNTLVCITPNEKACGALEHITSFSAHWGKLYRTSALPLNLYRHDELGHLIEAIPKLGNTVIIPNIFHFWTQRSTSQSKSQVVRFNYNSLSPCEELLSLHSNWLNMLTECDADNEENILIINQNLINQLISLLPSFESLRENYVEIKEIAYQVLKYFKSLREMKNLFQYDQIVSRFEFLEKGDDNA